MKLRNRILCLLSILCLLGIFTSTHAAAADIITPFVDVTNTDWFFEPVMWAVQNSVTGGTSATTFSPRSHLYPRSDRDLPLQDLYVFINPERPMHLKMHRSFSRLFAYIQFLCFTLRSCKPNRRIRILLLFHQPQSIGDGIE